MRVETGPMGDPYAKERENSTPLGDLDMGLIVEAYRNDGIGSRAAFAEETPRNKWRTVVGPNEKEVNAITTESERAAEAGEEKLRVEARNIFPGDQTSEPQRS
jgi:hypothetical protein